jgi:O-Antigen ligase
MLKLSRELLARQVLLFAVAGLLAIWPLPQTMALRNLLYLTGLLGASYLIQHQSWPSMRAGIRTYLPILMFFVWIVFHYAAWSVDRHEQLRELTGFWLRCLVASLLGMGLGASLVKNQQQTQSPRDKFSKRLLFASLFGTLVIYLLRYLYEVMNTGIWLHTDFYMTPFNGKPQIAIFITILLTAIFAGFPSSLKTRRNQWLAGAGLFTILCCLFVLYTANTKNGFLIFGLLVLAFVVKIVRGRMDYRTTLMIGLTCCVLVAVGYLHVQSNPAWRNIIPDVKVGLDIENNSYWKNWISEPEPINELGVAVNQSTYLRTAWFRAATELIRENPQGYGLMSYSFSYLAKHKWPDFYSRENDHMVATHSGWTDLTLAFGLPALLLVQFSWWRSYARARHFSGYWYRYIRWTVPTITFAYLTVEVSYDVFFELLFLLLGLFAALTQGPLGQSDASTNSLTS